MLTHLESQCAVLVQGISAFETFISKLHSDFKSGAIGDWPVVVLATTFQATATSVLKVLPESDDSSEILDRRSIASLVRNLVDTHDVLEMVAGTKSSEEFELNRNFLGLYIASRVNKVQSAIDPPNAEDFYAHAKDWYWERIRNSPLYDKGMARIKSGESIFYKTRKDRVALACGEDTDFVIGVLADLSTFVHSIPPPLWFGGIDNLYSNTEQNRDMVAVWIRIANFYLARSMAIVLHNVQHEASAELKEFIDYHTSVFS